MTQSLQEYIARWNGDKRFSRPLISPYRPSSPSPFQLARPRLILETFSSRFEIFPPEDVKNKVANLNDLWELFLLAPHINLVPSFEAIDAEIKETEHVFHLTIESPEVRQLAHLARNYRQSYFLHRHHHTGEAVAYARQALGYQINRLIECYRYIAGVKIIDSRKLIEAVNWFHIPAHLATLHTQVSTLYRTGRHHQLAGDADLARAYFTRAIRKTESIEYAAYKEHERTKALRLIQSSFITGLGTAIWLLLF